ncbi:MAG: YidC/Oxa1 family membrane protein insertase, partial [Candidatus Saccharimonadales bacterium]
MSLFDTLIVQPIFNLLAVIYGLLPGNDFGISLILFTILVRLLMWPLVKKQLHQTKLIRKLQPELKKIKAKAKGNRQLEGQLMMELYRERGVKPFSSIGLLFLQLPIFIALFRVIQIITDDPGKIQSYTYGWVEQLQPIAAIINDVNNQFDATLLGLLDLTKHGLSAGGIYWPTIAIAAVAAGLQYIQSRQITPQPDSNKRLRDVFKDSAAGKNVDSSEMNTLLTNRMIILFPFLTFAVGINLPGALVLYFATSSAVAVIQQHLLLKQDVEEMEVVADMDTKP